MVWVVKDAKRSHRYHGPSCRCHREHVLIGIGLAVAILRGHRPCRWCGGR